jgi:hypothetical protein
VDISANSDTLVVGGPNDNSNQGAAWIYIQSGGPWTQQGTKLVGTGNTGAAMQGNAVAMSSDGNTVASGGYADDSNQGAVWIFTRSGTVWSQQGSKLVGTGNTGAAYQGISVAMSSDGNTVASGGQEDNSGIGAVWVFIRSGGVWSQQGSKLVGTGNSGNSKQGTSLALDSNGDTLAVGASADNSQQGAIWIFVRSSGSWSQQGSKLVGTGVGAGFFINQGSSVALSSDGNTLAGGAPSDDYSTGATWIYTRTGSTWSQQGSKLKGTGATSGAAQGSAVALSADGNTLGLTSFADTSSKGAFWKFTRSGSTWTQQGSKTAPPTAGSNSRFGKSLAIPANFPNRYVAGGHTHGSSVGSAWIYM